MTHIGFIESTGVVVISATAATFEVEGPAWARRSLVMSSDVTFHLARNAVATTDALRVPANEMVRVDCYGDDVLSFVADADGTVWIAQTN